jgi:hypothetical protein
VLVHGKHYLMYFKQKVVLSLHLVILKFTHSLLLEHLLSHLVQHQFSILLLQVVVQVVGQAILVFTAVGVVAQVDIDALLQEKILEETPLLKVQLLLCLALTQ